MQELLVLPFNPCLPRPLRQEAPHPFLLTQASHTHSSRPMSVALLLLPPPWGQASGMGWGWEGTGP